MKKVLVILAVVFAGFAAACNNASEADASKDSVIVETASLTADSTSVDTTQVQ